LNATIGAIASMKHDINADNVAPLTTEAVRAPSAAVATPATEMIAAAV
jgi:hypothetical protein